MNPIEDAKKLMEETKSNKSEEKFTVPVTATSVTAEVPKVIVTEIKTPHENLILESKKNNSKIPIQGINIKPNTYDKILVILKDGGMDSASQVKSLERIKEVLSDKEE